MPVTIHTGYLNVRDDNGEYIRYNTVAEETVQEMVEDIEAKGAEVRDSIPDDYTALSNNVTALQGQLDGISISMSWEQGGLSVSSGNIPSTANAARIRTTTFIDIANIVSINCATGYLCAPFCWDANDTYMGWLTSSGILSTSLSLTTSNAHTVVNMSTLANLNVKKIKVVALKSNGENLLPEAGSNIIGTTTVKAAIENLADDVDDIVADIESQIGNISQLANYAYVTDSLDTTKFQVTVKRVDKYTIKVYNASSPAAQISNILPWNGESSIESSGDYSPAKNVSSAVTHFILETSKPISSLKLCYTTSTITNRTEYATSGATQTIGTCTLQANCAFFLRFSKDEDFGPEDNPTYIKLALYDENGNFDEILNCDVTARDEAARNDIKVNVKQDTSYNRGPFAIDGADFVDYYSGLNTSYDAANDGFGWNTTYADVLAKFDTLLTIDEEQSYQTGEERHIKKNALINPLSSSDPQTSEISGTDYQGNSYSFSLYEYVFEPYAYTNASLNEDARVAKIPTVLIDASIHGFEKNSTYGLYYFLYDLVVNYKDNPVLQTLRDNVRFKVIPVVNPWGFDYIKPDITPQERGKYNNENDVNINRNFQTRSWKTYTNPDPTGHPENDGKNSGLVPFDQPESAIIRDWINANADNLLIYINVHTQGQYNSVGYNNINSCMPKFERTNGDVYFNRLAYIVKRHIQRQTQHFPEMYPSLTPGPREFCGRYQAETGNEGTAAIWAAENGYVSTTLEGFNGLKVDGVTKMAVMSPDSKKANSEILGNFVIETIFEYAK